MPYTPKRPWWRDPEGWLFVISVTVGLLGFAVSSIHLYVALTTMSIEMLLGALVMWGAVAALAMTASMNYTPYRWTGDILPFLGPTEADD